MFDFLKNTFFNRGRYKTHSEAVIVSCFYNPQNSPYRLLAWQKWYHSIKHLNHRVVECLIGDARPQLPDSDYITRIQTESLLCHKETLLNKLFAKLPQSYRYVFWMDADVLMTNQDWLVQAVDQLESNCTILQPFEYCIHLERNKLKPEFDVEAYRSSVNDPTRRHKSMWKSFCANHVLHGISGDNNYDRHGHVGFLWGAKREVIDECQLFDKALIGGSDHILAHAAAGQIPHNCINKSFTDNIEEVLEWSRRFYHATEGRIGYVPGDLYHIWHGDIVNRQYLQRIKDFTGETKNLGRDGHGLYVKRDKNTYMKRYYRQREVTQIYEDDFGDFDAGFYDDMGYMIWDIINMFGQPSYSYDDDDDVPDVSMQQQDQGVNVNQFVPQDVPGVPADATFSRPDVPPPVNVPQEVYSHELGTGNVDATLSSVDSSNFS